MKTVYCDLCGQQLTEAEVEDLVRLPAEPGQPWWRPGEALLMFPQLRRQTGGRSMPAGGAWPSGSWPSPHPAPSSADTYEPPPPHRGGRPRV